MINKRLAILGIRGIPARYGGFETFAEEISVRLVKRGGDVTVFCDTTDAGKSEYKGVKLRYVRSFKLGPLTTIIHDLRCILDALNGYDIIYMLGYGAGPFFWIPRLFKRPIWVNMDGLEWKRSKWPWYGRLYLKISEWFAVKFASLLIADAEGIKDYLTSKYGKAINCHTIPYGAEVVVIPPDSHLIKNFELEPFEYYLVVCRLEPENHVKEIIEGFQASDTNKKLIIVGDHRTNTAYSKEILKTDDSRIRFIGTIFDKELLKAVRYYSFAYFHGHCVGGTNPSLLEALSCGNIVVAHDNVFNREVAGEVGLYFRSSDEIPTLVEAVESMDESEKSDLSIKAREQIRNNYAWEIVVDMYQKILKIR